MTQSQVLHHLAVKEQSSGGPAAAGRNLSTSAPALQQLWEDGERLLTIGRGQFRPPVVACGGLSYHSGPEDEQAAGCLHMLTMSELGFGRAGVLLSSSSFIPKGNGGYGICSPFRSDKNVVLVLKYKEVGVTSSSSPQSNSRTSSSCGDSNDRFSLG